MTNTKEKGKIAHTLLIINTIPLIFLGLLTVLLSYHWFSMAMLGEVETELSSAAANIEHMLEVAYPGDYVLKGEIAYRLYKGEHDLTNDYSLVEQIKEDTGFEVTLFYQDTRILTTIRNSDGVRIVGTGAPEVVKESVLQKGEPHFYDNTFIGGTGYFCYYAPLYNSDGSIVGMIFLGKPRKNVDAAIYKAVYPLLFVDLLAALIIAVINFRYNKKFVSALLKIHSFLSEVSKGNLSASLDASVLSRNDELSEIGYSAIHMQHSISTMVEQDALTKLFNRRFANRKLKQIHTHSQEHGTPFCVAIGDIDFFKKVNDTYGHECGDMVLKAVSDCLKAHMYSRGFAARWGGEEFLLVYEYADLETARENLELLANEIRAIKCEFEGQTISVTMTFGLTAGNTEDITLILRDADNKLYEGKAGGRNRIVS